MCACTCNDVAMATDTMHTLLTVSFSSVPKVSPSLGLKVGHDRRDVAAARKPRPPTRKSAALQVRHTKMSCKFIS